MAAIGTFIETRTTSFAAGTVTSFTHGLGAVPHMTWATARLSANVSGGSVTSNMAMIYASANSSGVTAWPGSAACTATFCMARWHSIIQ